MWGKEERVSGFICETVRADTTKGDGGGGATQAEKSLFGEGGGGMHCSKNVAYNKMTLCVCLQEYIIVYSGDFFNSAQ